MGKGNSFGRKNTSKQWQKTRFPGDIDTQEKCEEINGTQET